MSKAVYMTFLVGGSIIGFLLFAAFIAADGGISAEEIAPVVVPLLLIVAVAHLRFVYMAWSSIRDGRPRMSPGKAVGLLFVPIFNVYWLFQVYGGFATDYNDYVQQNGVETARLSRGLLVWNAILWLMPIPLISWIVLSKAISRVCSAVNAIQVRQRGAVVTN